MASKSPSLYILNSNTTLSPLFTANGDLLCVYSAVFIVPSANLCKLSCVGTGVLFDVASPFIETTNFLNAKSYSFSSIFPIISSLTGFPGSAVNKTTG